MPHCWSTGNHDPDDVRKHYTDDGEFTACAEYPIDGLPDG